MAAQSPSMRRKTTAAVAPPTLKKTKSSFSVSGDQASSSSSFMPSIYGIMASRRLAKQFVSRFRRSGRHFTGSQSDRSSKIGIPHVKKEPTYRMEPRRKFNTVQVDDVIKDIVDKKLQGFTYDPVLCPAMSKSLTEEIKDGVKMLCYDRYKIVCMVTIGENSGQGIRMGSRCAWDTKVDNCSTYTWQEGNAFCSVSVYGIYHE